MKKKYNLNLTEIGGRLKTLREDLKITLDKMHRITGFSTSLISAAENGLKKPSAIYLAALLELYHVNLNWVFTGKGPVFLPQAEEKNGKLHFDDTYDEMTYMLENVEMVRYAMLTEYLKFKIQHPHEIDLLLGSKKKEG
jgi:transcriptional regulator with XRE-family HTH domain